MISYNEFRKLSIQIAAKQFKQKPKSPSTLKSNKQLFFPDIPEKYTELHGNCIKLGYFWETLYNDLMKISTDIEISKYSGMTIDGVDSDTSRSGKKQIDMAFIKNGRLYILEMKSNLELDNKAWPEVVKGCFSIANRINETDDSKPAISYIIFGPTNETIPEHGKIKMAEDMIVSQHHAVSCEIQGWRWLTNMLGVDISSEQHYNLCREIGSMILGNKNWSDEIE